MNSVAFKRGTHDAVVELHAHIGGALGMGETRGMIMPQRFKLADDRVVLSMTEAQTEDLPKVKS